MWTGLDSKQSCRLRMLVWHHKRDQWVHSDVRYPIWRKVRRWINWDQTTKIKINLNSSWGLEDERKVAQRKEGWWESRSKELRGVSNRLFPHRYMHLLNSHVFTGRRSNICMRFLGYLSTLLFCFQFLFIPLINHLGVIFIRNLTSVEKKRKEHEIGLWRTVYQLSHNQPWIHQQSACRLSTGTLGLCSQCISHSITNI